MTLPNILAIGMTADRKHAGGVDRYYFNLLQALAKRGLRGNGLVAGTVFETQENFRMASFGGVQDSMLARMRAIRKAGPPLVAQSDLVVSHFAPYALPLLGRLQRKPLVTHFHGPWALESKTEGASAYSITLKRLIERTVYRASTRVIVLSQAFADIATHEYRVPFDRVRIVPGGVDVERFAPTQTRAQARARLGWPANRPTVVTVRRLVRAKGIENLIEAAKLARAEIPALFVAIVGTGPLAGELQRAIDAHGLTDTVRMVGHASEDDLPSIYRAADLFAVPSIALEGFGLVVIESLASGTPALVTPVGGLPEVVRDLDAGSIFASTSPQDIAHHLVRALDGTLSLPSEAECIAYAERFRWDEIAHRVADLYREAVHA